ncbi:peptidase U61 [Geobacillus sp. FJAT-46040]|uniref:peptidase U61 n=1 Tax=Geobacillus TaxID=129337 RepID=UPI000BB85500|nr:peptidase U61 [Geobacillus sp. FJAT-46040]
MTRGYEFPVVYDADFGHTDPMAVLPKGIQAGMKTDKSGSVAFRLPERAVE